MRRHHPLHEPVELAQRFGRRVRNQRLQRLPLGFPLVPVETGIAHGDDIPHSTPFKPARTAPTTAVDSLP
jgi:hypothetical protein